MTRRRSQTRPVTHDEVVARIRAAGYVVVLGASHLKVQRPNGSYFMTMSVSPSDHRAAVQAWRLFERLRRAE